ncbi:polyphosphate kinase 1 [Rubellicoccus peritrichatus]|uniref:Polyphosphate kinase n=1 Tax=Rubellicoccus peritrichatus TaxID=3080537 RepID=A0AAQ3LCU9_9BACT|nr:polyphosphate kinase 1 [Puniceicoccus sp. CR14]WOO42114.1 polyphosphate kinase 1 [Puniceicoccus sp. CR14]
MPAKKAIKKTPKKKSPYFNRELSWLSFNRRVLDLALSKSQPLLERLKFLSIVTSNLDEFFEIRVAGLIQQVEAGVVRAGIDGLGPKEQLRRIHDITSALVKDTYECWRNQIVPNLKGEGITFKQTSELTRKEKSWLDAYFQEQVYPVLTPMAIDPAHPFPQLANKSLNILLCIDDPSSDEEESKIAIIPVPRILPRVIQIETRDDSIVCIFLSDLIKMFVKRLFPGYKIKGAWAFRITRNSDLYIDEEEVENLLKTIEEEIHKMRRGDPVRLEIEDQVDSDILGRLLQAIELSKEYVYLIDGPINLMRLMSVYGMIDRPDLKDTSFHPYTPHPLAVSSDIFQSISKEDHLLHHPYDSFGPVVEFLNTAARDPQVFAIKQTLYRTSGDSPIINALKLASENGKQVTALVELKARFDELNNIQWARELEEKGVHVVYGLVGLKTHCKTCLVVRRENDGLRRYCHLGTGNYNPKTAKIYTDLSLFTASEEITSEVADLFNTLTGFSRKPEFKHLLIAPFNLHAQMQKLIQRETRNAKAGKPARIIAKTNSLIEKDTIDNLYQASKAGVKINCIVRGICGLVPGVTGLSENITVHSILGRFLEHSRIYYFENTGGEPEVYIGSADWMPRNFFRRIECVFPIKDPKLKAEIIDNIIPAMLRDTTATLLKSNGAYRQARHRNQEAFSSQDFFLEQAGERQDKDEGLLAEG